MADRTVSVRVQARVDQYVASMQKMAKSTHDAAKNADQDLQWLGSRMQNVGTKMTLGLTLPLALAAKSAVGYASAASETTNKVAQAFGRNADAIRSWSENAARAMGLSQQEAQNSAASFGTMFREMGLGSNQVVDMSERVVQLAGDLGSFWDVDPSEMLDSLRSGLVGEIEPLRRFGILLSDQAVRAEAVKMGLAATTTEVSETAKVQARYALILDQTGTAQGDYARTADGAANSMRTARAAYKDAMAELGDNLLPIVAKGAATFTDFAEAFGRMPEAGQSVLLGVGGFAAILGPAVFITGGLIRNLQTIQELGPRAAAALKWGGIAAGIGAAAIAAGNLADVLFKVHTNAADVLDDVANIAKQGSGQVLPSYSDRADDLELLARDIKQIADPSLGDKVAHTIEYLIPGKGPDRIHEATSRLNELDAALAALSSTGSPEAAAAAMDGIVAALEGEGISREDLIARLPQYAALLQQAAIAEQFSGDAAGGAATEVEKLGGTVDDLMDSAFGVSGAADALTADVLAFAQAVRDAKADGNQFATSLDTTSIEGLKNRATLQGLAEDALKVAQKMADMGQSPVAAMQQVRTQLIETAVQLGFNRTEAANFFDVLMQVGNLKVAPQIGLDTNPARAALQRLFDAAQGVWKSIQSMFGNDTSDMPRWLVPAETPAGLAGGFGPGVANVTSGLSAPPSGSEKPQTSADEFEANKYRAGGISAEEYKAYLNDRLAQTERFSNEWMTIWSQIDQVNQDIGAGWKAASDQIKENEDEWMRVLRVQHEIGELSTADYIQQLEKRLTALKMYSDEWFQVWQEIHQLKDEITQEQLDIIAAVDKQRRYDEAWFATEGQRNLQAAREPGVVLQAGATTTRTYSPTFHVTTADPDRYSANQKMRDDAFLAGV